MACHSPPLEKAKKQAIPILSPIPFKLVKNFVREKKKDNKIGLFQQFVSQLPHTLDYVCEYFCELLGSITLSACWVCFGVCSFFGHYLGNT